MEPQIVQTVAKEAVFYQAEQLGKVHVGLELASSTLTEATLSKIAECLHPSVEKSAQLHAYGMGGLYPDVRNDKTPTHFTTRLAEEHGESALILTVNYDLSFPVPADTLRTATQSVVGEVLSHSLAHLDDPHLETLRKTLEELAQSPIKQLEWKFRGLTMHEGLIDNFDTCQLAVEIIDRLTLTELPGIPELLKRTTPTEDGMSIDLESVPGADEHTGLYM